MSDLALRVVDLSKRYRIGGNPTGSRRSIARRLAGSFDYMLSTFREPAEAETLWALRDISFDVKQGEVIGIIGHNGAGKSTLLKILSRITEPTSGYAELYGRVGSLLEVGTGFNPELTGRENIYLNGVILGMKKTEIDRKFDEIVAFAGTERFLDTPVKRYSSGMYVRLAFAVAAHLEPEILIVDEVLAVGDAEFQKKALGKMGSVVNEGRTVLFVSHNMAAISSLCNRVISIEGGAIRKDGIASNVVSDYLSALEAINSANLDSARIKGHDNSVRFTEVALDSSQIDGVKFGSAVSLRLSIFGEKRRQNLSIGLSIYNSSGVCVGTTITRDEFDIQPKETKFLQIIITEPLLAPGKYSTGLSIGFGGYKSKRFDYDVVIGVPYFQILPISTNGGFIANWNPTWGNIVLNCTLKSVKNNENTI